MLDLFTLKNLLLLLSKLNLTTLAPPAYYICSLSRSRREKKTILSLALYMQLTYERSTQGSGDTVSLRIRLSSSTFSFRLDNLICFGSISELVVFLSFSLRSIDFSYSLCCILVELTFFSLFSLLAWILFTIFSIFMSSLSGLSAFYV